MKENKPGNDEGMILTFIACCQILIQLCNQATITKSPFFNPNMVHHLRIIERMMVKKMDMLGWKNIKIETAQQLLDVSMLAENIIVMLLSCPDVAEGVSLEINRHLLDKFPELEPYLVSDESTAG